MTLAIQRGATIAPQRLWMFGQEGVGKTTFATQIPNALFLTVEDGGGDLEYPKFICPTWQDLRNAVESLINDAQGFRTVVIDTIDSFEKQLHIWLVNQYENAKSIEDLAGGFGKGYNMAAEQMVQLSNDFERLRKKQKMNVVLLGHATVKKFDDPMGNPYDRYEPRVHKQVAAVWGAWVDCLLFACFDVTVKTTKRKNQKADDPTQKGKAVGLERTIFTTKDAAYDAKNRYNLPDELPLSWKAFSDAIGWDRRDAAVLGQKEFAFADLERAVGAERAIAIRFYLDAKKLKLGPSAVDLKTSAEVDQFVNETHASFKRAFFKAWNELSPEPTQKEGNTKEDVDAAKAAIEANRKLVVQKWYGVDSLTDVPLKHILHPKGPRNEAWLRSVDKDGFRAAVDEVLGS